MSWSYSGNWLGKGGSELHYILLDLGRACNERLILSGIAPAFSEDIADYRNKSIHSFGGFFELLREKIILLIGSNRWAVNPPSDLSNDFDISELTVPDSILFVKYINAYKSIFNQLIYFVDNVIVPDSAQIKESVNNCGVDYGSGAAYEYFGPFVSVGDWESSTTSFGIYLRKTETEYGTPGIYQHTYDPVTGHYSLANSLGFTSSYVNHKHLIDFSPPTGYVLKAVKATRAVPSVFSCLYYNLAEGAGNYTDPIQNPSFAVSGLIGDQSFLIDISNYNTPEEFILTTMPSELTLNDHLSALISTQYPLLYTSHNINLLSPPTTIGPYALSTRSEAVAVGISLVPYYDVSSVLTDQEP